mmetsp:Transcript_23915/g.32754  ORF Transcript_23915/g.32754 Transcript_23915/m.32754 type:complete len:234 (-) Transcript_23915:75-776(-)
MGTGGSVHAAVVRRNSPITVGEVVPTITFKARVRDEAIGGPNPFTWKDVTTLDLFKGKRVVLFALPGGKRLTINTLLPYSHEFNANLAFTPTCSSSHVPGYEKNYEKLKSLGIDEVYCLSVNDAFVMRQWGISLKLEKEDSIADNPLNPGNFKKVKLIPDGAANFTRAMGFSCIWDTERGFGERSWRYSVVIKDMKVEKIFIEDGEVHQNSVADPFLVSDCDTMLTYLQESKK